MQESWILGAQMHLAYFPKGPLHLLIPSPGTFFLFRSVQYLPHFTQDSLNIIHSEITIILATILSKVTLTSLSSLLYSVLFYFTALIPAWNNIIHVFVSHCFFVSLFSLLECKLRVQSHCFVLCFVAKALHSFQAHK